MSTKYWHYCYKIYHPQSNSTYHGKHSTDSLADGYSGSGKGLANIPMEERIFEIVSFHDTEDDAYIAESLLVPPESIHSPFILNRVPGGRWGLTYQSHDQCVANGKRSWEINKNDPKGFHKATKEQMTEWSRLGGNKQGKISYEQKTGIHGMSSEDRSKIGKINYDLGYGLGGISHKDRVEIGTKVGKRHYELGVGIFAMSEDDRLSASSKGGKIGGAKTGATYGKHLGERSRERLSKPLIIDGIKYDSLKDAHTKTGISLRHLRKRCASPDWTNYVFVSGEAHS